MPVYTMSIETIESISMDRDSEIALLLCVYSGTRTEPFVGCVESVLSQSLVPDIMIWRDGPISEELSVYIEGLGERGEFVYIDGSEENRGIAPSYNSLISVALEMGYRYIARMDSDDICTPDRIEKQYRFMKENPDIDVVGGYIREFSEDGSYDKIVKYPREHEEMFRFFAKRVPIANVTSFFSATFFSKAGLYPEESPTNEDTLMWLKGFRRGCRFANIDSVAVEVRVDGGFFGRRGGLGKALSDFGDRAKVIRTLGYGPGAWLYATALFLVAMSPGFLKKILYERFR